MKTENPRMNHIFSKKKTNQGMVLRKYEKIAVKFAETDRNLQLRTSIIKNEDERTCIRFCSPNLTAPEVGQNEHLES